MVPLVEKIGRKLHFKLENRNHNHLHEEAVLASLQAFRSEVSKSLNQLRSNAVTNPEILSLSWIHKSFELLRIINRAFAKLSVNIDYPLSKWEFSSVEGYLKYSLSLLEFLNSISSSVSHLGQSRVRLSYALSLLEKSSRLAAERLKAIQPEIHSKKSCRIEVFKEDGEERFGSCKEWAIHQALMVLSSTGFWVCGVALSGLGGDVNPYMEIRNSASEFSNSQLTSLDRSVCEEMAERRGELKEVREVNEAVTSLSAAIAGGEDGGADEQLKMRLEVFGKSLESVESEVNQLFSEVLAGRNQLVGGLSMTKSGAPFT